MQGLKGKKKAPFWEGSPENKIHPNEGSLLLRVPYLSGGWCNGKTPPFWRAPRSYFGTFPFGVRKTTAPLKMGGFCCGVLLEAMGSHIVLHPGIEKGVKLK